MSALPATPATGRIVDIGAHAARMDEPLVSFRQHAPAGRAPAPPPAFLFGPMPAATSRMIYGQIELPETGCYTLADAAVAPTGIALARGLAFAGPQLNLPTDHVATITNRLNGAALPERYVPGPLALLFGPAEESHAQLLVDYLPRLWLLEQTGHPLAALRFLVPSTLPDRVEALLAATGITADQLVRYEHWAEVIRTDLLVLPTTLRRGERLSPGFGQATRFWVDRARLALGLPPPALTTRLFVATPGVLRNAEAIEAAALSAGFHVLQPEITDLVERAKLFSQAALIVGPYGAALHDSVFAAPGAVVCALRGTGIEPGFLQTGIGAALGHTQGYVFTDETNTIEPGDFWRALQACGS